MCENVREKVMMARVGHVSYACEADGHVTVRSLI